MLSVQTVNLINEMKNTIVEFMTYAALYVLLFGAVVLLARIRVSSRELIPSTR